MALPDNLVSVWKAEIMNRQLMTYLTIWLSTSESVQVSLYRWTDSIFVSPSLRSEVLPPNVCAEEPVFAITLPMTLQVVLTRQCSVKKVCLFSIFVYVFEKTNPHPTVIKLLRVPPPTPDGSHAAPRWTLKRQQRAQMGRVAFFRSSTFLFHRWVQIIFCAIVSDYCITVAKGGCIWECRGN